MEEPKIEPYRLKRWRWPEAPRLVVYTCARPGRSEEDTKKAIDDDQVCAWLRGLPPSIEIIIMLLGTKQDGRSEYCFYSFDETKVSPEAWLNSFGIRRVRVIERPTIDFDPVPASAIDAIREDLRCHLITASRIVIVDSGGVQRTAEVCKSLGMNQLPRFGLN